MEWDAFVMPFTPSLWTAVAFVMTVCTISLAITFHLKRRHGNENIEKFSLITAVLLSVGIFCQQGKYSCYLMANIMKHTSAFHFSYLENKMSPQDCKDHEMFLFLFLLIPYYFYT
jgi:uncharacterized membrane protein